MATTIRVYRDGTLVDTEVDPDDGDFAVTVDTTGWAAGTYNITATAQLDGQAESLPSGALGLTVSSALAIYGTPVVTSVTDTGTTSITSGTVTVPTGGARVFVAVMGVSGSAVFPSTISSTFSGAPSWTRVTGASLNVSDAGFVWGQRGVEWYYADVAAGTGTVTATFAVISYDRVIAAFVIPGSTTIGATACFGVDGTSGTLQNTLTASAGGHLVLIAVSDQATGTVPTALANTTYDGSLAAPGNSNAYAVGHASTTGSGNITVGSSTTTTAGFASALEVY